MSEEKVQDTVKKIFTAYLEHNGHRKTAERFHILREIYLYDGHFDVDALYLTMKRNKYEVSRATLYNTIELLLACKLVVKHQFGKNVAQFEKAFKYKQHDHIICIKCGKITEFCDARLQLVQNSAETNTNFKITHHSLVFYGYCEACTESVDNIVN